MQLSPHFTLEEAIFSSTATRLGIDNTPSQDIVDSMVLQAQGMELVCDALAFPVHVDSWFRCERLNQAVGGAASSAHLTGWATDFVCRQFGAPLDIARAVVKSGITFDQLIMEGTWVHISFRPPLRGMVLTAQFTPGKATTYITGLPTT